MIKRYKVIGAMLTLDEFTIDDLVQFSGVNGSTVRTIVRREKPNLTELGKLKTGQRGGRIHQYKINPEKITELKLKIEKIYEDIIGKNQSQLDESDAPEIPINLILAEDNLMRLYDNEKREERRKELVEMAEEYIVSARAEFNHTLVRSRFPRLAKQIEDRFANAEYLFELRKKQVKKIHGEAEPVTGIMPVHQFGGYDDGSSKIFGMLIHKLRYAIISGQNIKSSDPSYEEIYNYEASGYAVV